jgi:hypothetical protein
MRRIKHAASATVLACLAFSGFVTAPESGSAQAKAPILCWDHSGLDVSGQPEDLDCAEIALTLAGVNLQAGGKPLGSLQVPTKKGENQANLAPLLAGREAGNYLVWARVLDKSGNASTWAGPVPLVLGAAAAPGPAAPAPKEPAPAAPAPKARPAPPAVSPQPRPGNEAWKEPGKEPWKRHTPGGANGGCRSA